MANETAMPRILEGVTTLRVNEGHYKAWLTHGRRTWEAGSSEAEAIGKLFISLHGGVVLSGRRTEGESR